MPAKRNFGRCTSSQLSAESPVTREIEERIHKQAETHTHPLNGPFSGTTRVSRYQKGKTNLDFTEASDSETS